MYPMIAVLFKKKERETSHSTVLYVSESDKKWVRKVLLLVFLIAIQRLFQSHVDPDPFKAFLETIPIPFFGIEAYFCNRPDFSDAFCGGAKKTLDFSSPRRLSNVPVHFECKYSCDPVLCLRVTSMSGEAGQKKSGAKSASFEAREWLTGRGEIRNWDDGERQNDALSAVAPPLISRNEI